MEQMQGHYFGRAHKSLWISTELSFLHIALRQTFCWKQKPIHQTKEFLQRNINSLTSPLSGQFQTPMLFKVVLNLLKWPKRTQTFFKRLNPKPFPSVPSRCTTAMGFFSIKSYSSRVMLSPSKSPPQLRESLYQ